MKLTKNVLDAVRGIGGAALIATAAGCATTATTEPARDRTVNAPVAVTRPAPEKVRPDAPAEPDPEWRYDDMAAACGRG